MDKLRRFFFIIDAECVSFFEWTIWTSIFVLFLGVPAAMAILKNIFQGLFVPAITVVILWALTFLLEGIAGGMLRHWPFDISDEESDFEANYEPRIPND